MKNIMNLISFLWRMLIVGIVVNAGIWLAVKGVSLVFKGFGRLVNRTENI